MDRAYIKGCYTAAINGARMEHGVLHHHCHGPPPLFKDARKPPPLSPYILFFTRFLGWRPFLSHVHPALPVASIFVPTHFFLTRFLVGNLQAILSRREREDGGRTGGGGNGESRAQSANASNSEEQSGSRSKLWQDTVTIPNNGGGVTRLGSDSDSNTFRNKVRVLRGLGFRV